MSKQYQEQLEYLLSVVQDLSMVKNLDQIINLVRTAARNLTGADGATFVLRDEDRCYYADEDAIAPLWKGKRFNLNLCISGWTMTHGEAVVIPDVYADPRVPVEAYRPTFVKSLAMVPIRSKSPIGAIGNYWASHRTVEPHELNLLQALADSTSIAMENVELYNDLDKKVKERTAELESFSHSVSHDLKNPLTIISSYAEMINDDPVSSLSKEGRMYFEKIKTNSFKISQLIDALMDLARLTQKNLEREHVNLTDIVTEIADELRIANPDRKVEFQIQSNVSAFADPRMLRILLENLIHNAWKYSRNAKPKAVIKFGSISSENGTTYFVEDNGAGFDMASATRLFERFQRYHPETQFEGIGIGLATVHLILKRHGGKVWAKSKVGKGATFYFGFPSAFE